MSRIPIFPKFKKIELDDKKEVDDIIAQYPSYSDFNFLSLWSWNTMGQTFISKMNDSLILRLTDYVTHEPFYSFIGQTKVLATIDAIVRLKSKYDTEILIKLVPEKAINTIISEHSYKITEDEDNFDYIFPIGSLKMLSGSKLAAKRNYVRQFERKYQTEIRILDLDDSKIRKEIIDLYCYWAYCKGITRPFDESEYLAIVRFLNYPHKFNVLGVGIFEKEKLIAFWLLEMLKDNVAMSHFSKANVKDYTGIYPYLIKQTAIILDEKFSVMHLNHQQDLGIQGLREAKKDYKPSSFLKKYKISF